MAVDFDLPDKEGAWVNEQPENILPELKQLQVERWGNRLKQLLKSKVVHKAGRAVIAISLWLRNTEAPFNTAAAQHDSWSVIRHSLGGDKPETAIKRWANIAPLAYAICKKKPSFGEIMRLISEQKNERDIEFLAFALTLLSKLDLLSAAEIAQKYVGHSSPVIRSLAVDILGTSQNERYVDALQDVLNHDDHPGITHVAAEALGKIPGNKSEYALKQTVELGSVSAAILAWRVFVKNKSDKDIEFFKQAVLGARSNDIALVNTINLVNVTNKVITVEPRGAHVLVVEDNVPNFVLIARMLAFMGVERCEWKTSGWQVIQFADTLPRVDLILTDIRLPYEDGYQVLEKIRTHPRLRDTTVCAVTAEASEDQMRRAKKAGFNGFLSKPLDSNRFPDQVRRLMAGEEVWEWK